MNIKLGPGSYRMDKYERRKGGLCSAPSQIGLVKKPAKCESDSHTKVSVPFTEKNLFLLKGAPINPL